MCFHRITDASTLQVSKKPHSALLVIVATTTRSVRKACVNLSIQPHPPSGPGNPQLLCKSPLAEKQPLFEKQEVDSCALRCVRHNFCCTRVIFVFLWA